MKPSTPDYAKTLSNEPQLSLRGLRATGEPIQDLNDCTTIELNRTQLTNRYACNPERSGAVTPARLYNEVIPDLIKRGLARELPREGKGHIYQFTVEGK